MGGLAISWLGWLNLSSGARLPTATPSELSGQWADIWPFSRYRLKQAHSLLRLTAPLTRAASSLCRAPNAESLAEGYRNSSYSSRLGIEVEVQGELVATGQRPPAILSPGWHQRACLSLRSVLSLPGSGDPNTPHAHLLIHYVPSSHATSTLLREIVTGRGSEAGIEGNHGGVGGSRQRLRDGGRGSVLLYFTLESSINNAKSKRLQVSGSGLWDVQQPIRLPPPTPRV